MLTNHVRAYVTYKKPNFFEADVLINLKTVRTRTLTFLNFVREYYKRIVHVHDSFKLMYVQKVFQWTFLYCKTKTIVLKYINFTCSFRIFIIYQ